MKFVCIHGIYAKEGNHNMGRFAEALSRRASYCTVDVFEYGFTTYFATPWRNPDAAKELAAHSKVTEDNEFTVWVTHSNGAAVAYLATRDYGAAPDMIVNFNPALDRWRTAPVQWVETVFSRGDRAVWLAQWVPGHIGGDQGRVGYRGKLKNTISHNASNFGGKMEYGGHSDAFDPVRINLWVDWVRARAESMERILKGRV